MCKAWVRQHQHFLAHISAASAVPHVCACRLHSTIDRWPQCPHTSPPQPGVRGCQAARREGAVQVLLLHAGQHSGANAGAWPVAARRDQGVTTHTSAQSASGEVTSSHVDPAVSKRAALAVLRRTACLANADAACKRMHRQQKGCYGQCTRCRDAVGQRMLSAAHKA